MPPNTNDTPEQNQPVSTPPVEPATTNSQNSQTPVDDTVPPTVIPQTEEVKQEEISSATPVSEPIDTSPNTPNPLETPVEPSSSDLASPPPVNEASMPANNRPTLDTINAQPETPTDSLEKEIDTLPNTSPIENPEPEQEPSVPSSHNDSPLEAATTTEPTPTPPAFPETAGEPQEPKKKGFFSKFFKHK
jgi:hypothetical protein